MYSGVVSDGFDGWSDTIKGQLKDVLLYEMVLQGIEGRSDLLEKKLDADSLVLDNLEAIKETCGMMCAEAMEGFDNDDDDDGGDDW